MRARDIKGGRSRFAEQFGRDLFQLRRSGTMVYQFSSLLNYYRLKFAHRENNWIESWPETVPENVPTPFGPAACQLFPPPSTTRPSNLIQPNQGCFFPRITGLTTPPYPIVPLGFRRQEPKKGKNVVRAKDLRRDAYASNRDGRAPGTRERFGHDLSFLLICFFGN
jgi:hypothetical protein